MLRRHHGRPFVRADAAGFDTEIMPVLSLFVPCTYSLSASFGHKGIANMILWTDYLKYGAGLRGVDLLVLEEVLRFSEERNFDTVTGRQAVIGRHRGLLCMIPYEQVGDDLVPVTVHATARQQINLRLKSGRFQNE